MAGFPQARRLPEDVLEYLLIPQLPERIEEDNVVPSLERISDSYLGHIGPMVIDYIWQNEGFTLKTVAAQGSFRSCHSCPSCCNCSKNQVANAQILFYFFKM